MAIYHLSVKTISRSDGRSATAAAAYRAAASIVDERTGEVHDYSRKSGVVSAQLFLPENAPAWAEDRAQLWNAAEQSETRKNSTVAREFEIALPSELTAEQREKLVADFCVELVARYGFAVDAAIHSPGKDGDNRNDHAHLLGTTRELTADGFTKKTRVLDDRATGALEVLHLRERWAELTNAALERAGSSARVDHRSLAAQGIDREPTQHLGPAATAIERRGEISQKTLNKRERDASKSKAKAKPAPAPAVAPTPAPAPAPAVAPAPAPAVAQAPAPKPKPLSRYHPDHPDNKPKEQKMATDSSMQITLKTLEREFGVDISDAAGLAGAELNAWCEKAEDRIFEQQMAEKKAHFAAMANDYQEHKTAGKDPALFVPTPAQAPSPEPTQSLSERLIASLNAMLNWIKTKGGELQEVKNGTLQVGPIVQANDFHAVQKTSRNGYVVHEQSRFKEPLKVSDKVLDLQYSKTGTASEVAKSQGQGRAD